MSVTPSPIGGFAAQFFDNNGVILSGGKIYTYAAGTTTPQATYTSAAGVTPHANPIILDSAGRVPGGEIWLTDGLVYKFVIDTSTGILIGSYDNITGVNSNFVNYTVQEEVITATAGQTVFNLSTINYTPGTNSLTVYIDGVNQYVGDSYLETDSNTVTFTSGVHVGGEVKFTTAIQTTTGAVDASIVSFTQAGAGAVQQTVQTKLEQYVSVKDFGADGSATAAANLTAFKAAVAAVPTGGSLIVPADATPYIINISGGLSTAIEINKRMEIVFEGDVKASASAIQANPTYIFNVTADNVIFTGAGGKIIGDGTTNSVNTGTDATFPGLVYVTGDNFTMTDCVIDTPPKVGVMLYNCQGAKITNNTFTGGPTTYTDTSYFAVRAFQGSAHNISDNLFTPDGSGGMFVTAIFFNGTASSVINSNVCVYPYEKLLYCVGDKNVVSNNQVIGNPNNIPGSSPVVKGTITSVYRFDGDNNLCVGNYSDYCAAGATCFNSKGNIIKENTFLRCGQLGVVVFETAGYVDSISGTAVSDNYITFDATMGFSLGFGGIQINASQSAATNITVKNNYIDTFSNAAGAAIYVVGTSGTKITKSNISGNVIGSSVNGIIANYVEQTTITQNAMSAISNAMIVQSSTCNNNIITGNQSTDAVTILDSGYSTNSTYLNNQNTIAPLTGLVTLSAASSTLVAHGGTRVQAKVFLQAANASAATLVSGSKSPYVTVTQPNFSILTADGTAAAGTEQFWYTIVQ